MKLLLKLITNPKIFQRTLGLSLEQFELLITRMVPVWNQAEKCRKDRADRERKIGGGRSYKCETLGEMVVIVLLYYKTYMTQEFVGILVDLNQGNVSRLLKKMLPLIEKAADPELATYLAQAKAAFDKIPSDQRINSWGDFLKKHPDLREASTDATEQRCHRSDDYETQKRHYSGKKKHHSLKTQMTVSETGRVLDISKTVPGSVHDKKLADQEGTVEKIPEKTVQRMDSAYQGMVAEHPNHYIVLPHKKPRGEALSPLAKEMNRVNSKRRVIVENVLSRLKKFRICSGLYRGSIDDYNAVFRNVAALINFKLATPA